MSKRAPRQVHARLPSSPPEPRLAWALVEASLCPSDAPGAPERLAPRGDRLHPPAPRDHAGDYRLASLADYAHLPPRRRPPAFCPVCRERVWMKLGPRRRYHYAHALEDSTCPAASAEGALHLAAKLHLATLLQWMDALPIARLCNRSPNDLSVPCRAVEHASWIAGCDEVRVEHAIPSIRADIMLLAGGSEIGAIEVFASHAVDEEKAARYRTLGIPWIEVPAARVTDLWRPLWDGGSPLPVRADSGAPPWRCPRHSGLFAAWEDHERNGVHRLAGRFVHLYRVDGGVSASLLRAERVPVVAHERRENGECAEAWLVREDTGQSLGRPVVTSDRAVAMRMLHREFVRWVRWTRNTRGAVIDSPMQWTPASALPAEELDTLFPERARWDPHTASFSLPPNAPALAWPVLDAGDSESLLVGAAECFWTALPERDRPAMVHGCTRRLWATLQVEQWRDAAGERSRGLVYLYRHDGRAWRQWGSGPAVCDAVPGFDWDAAFPEMVRALADVCPDEAPPPLDRWLGRPCSAEPESTPGPALGPRFPG